MNPQTTQFIGNQGLEFRQLERCHDGVGAIGFKDLIARADPKLAVKFIHYDVIPPGASIGEHRHDEPAMEEWYLCLEGEGIMTLDGKDITMKPGDVSVCRTGGSHGLRNAGEKELRLIVIGA